MPAKLPSGKELAFIDIVKFCYDLSETDIELLFKLVNEGDKTIDEISSELGLSKATVSRSLNRLLGLGFIERNRVPSGVGIGRPKYVYRADRKKIEEKLRRDIDYCVAAVKDYMSRMFNEGGLAKLGR